MVAKRFLLRAKKSNQVEILPSGMYSYHTDPTSPDQFRLHLRVEPDGNGILVVNAATVLHLNQTATEIAYNLIQGQDSVQIVDSISTRYDTSREVLMRDVQLFIDQIRYLTQKTDLSPAASIGFEPHIFDQNLTAPLRIDCCLTYRGFDSDYDSLPSVDELTTEDWKTILKRLYDAGIPHAIFFGGEPTLRSDLVELFAYTEQLGLISGLVSSDPKLKDPAFLMPLIDAGLDHLTFCLDPSVPEDLAGLSNILDQDLFTCLRLPVHPDRDYHDLILQLRALGANAFSLLPQDEVSHAKTSQLQNDLTENGIAFIDDAPLTYHPHQPELLFNPWDPETQPDQQLVIKPDGSLAHTADSQSDYGNLLREEWSSLWARVMAGGAD